jgi:hypothetical protein
MIPTYHDTEIKTERKRIKYRQKPACITDYDKIMGGVDLKDQLQVYAQVLHEVV